MVFSSVTFLFLFLPLVLLFYHAIELPSRLGYCPRLCRQLSNLLLLLASVLFYFWGENFRIGIMLLTAGTDYTCGLIMAGGLLGGEVRQLAVGGPRSRLQKTALAASIIANLSLLGFFKYFGFGVASYNRLLGLAGLDALQWHNTLKIALPLGISFYTFQSMSYTIDVYRGHARATRNLFNFACFVTLFPQLVAGPIVRYVTVSRELASRAVTSSDFARGATRFVIGLGKKVLIANVVAAAVDQIFALPAAQLGFETAWLGIIGYTLQIYFDFSGYSDMAIGMAQMFGFHLLENFNYPYTARSVQDFWRRWHISLSTWFRDYLYIPLGGSRGAAAAPSSTWSPSSSSAACGMGRAGRSCSGDSTTASSWRPSEPPSARGWRGCPRRRSDSTRCWLSCAAGCCFAPPTWRRRLLSSPPCSD